MMWNYASRRFVVPMLVALSLVLGLVKPLAAANASPKLSLRQDDRVIFIGNTFAERLVWHGYFEALLASRFPQLNLTFRNLAFSGDEALRGKLGTGAGPGSIGPIEENAFLQLRALNFGDIFGHIEQERADVIFACYGMNESFAGAATLPKFEKDLRTFLMRLVDLRCGAKRTAPRVVLVSPIPHENLGGDLPDPAKHNESLRAYTDAMRKVAGEMSMPFVDLFNPIRPLMEEKTASPLTFNGIHLTRYGNWVAAQVIMEQLGFMAPPPTFEVEAGKPSTITLELLPVPPPPSGANVHAIFARKLPIIRAKGVLAGNYKLRVNGRDVADGTAAEWQSGKHVQPVPDASQALVAAVDDKNWEYFMKYRAVNGEYIYGRRRSPFGVVNFPKEFELQEKLVAEKDGKVRELARGNVPLKIEWVKSDH